MQAKDERVRAMLSGRRFVRVIPFPGSDDISVGLRVLTEREIDEARLDAISYVRGEADKRRIDPVQMLAIDSQLVDREAERAMLFRACIDPETASDADPKRFFDTQERLRQIDSVIVKSLFEAYLDHQDYVSPYRLLSDDEARELADAISKGQSATALLAQFDAPMLRRLLRSMAALLSSAPTSKSDTSGSSNSDGPS